MCAWRILGNTYICELERDAFRDSIAKSFKGKLKFTTSARLCVPWTIFDKKIHRNPAVVFLNSHFLVFCECEDSAVIRRGKLTGKNSINWKETNPILKESNASFQGLIPIVSNEEQGKVILMCIRKNTVTKEKKLIVEKSYNNGQSWSGRKDVFKLESVPDLLKGKFLIGHGVCLQSGKLVVSGVSELQTNKNILFVLTSEDAGESWDILVVPSPVEPSLTMDTQVTEYAKNHVFITCSSKDSKQWIHVFSNNGCKTFDRQKMTPTSKQANPGQAGIVSIPVKSDIGYWMTAFTSSSSSENFENLTVHLSDDGCKTWTTFIELGSPYMKRSDLAYYEVRDGNKMSRGLACVYETDSSEHDLSIVMQLISLDKIVKEGKIKTGK